MAWKPRRGKLPWQDKPHVGPPRSKEDFEWETAVGKWQPIAEEAGVHNSGLARSIADIHKDPRHALALDRSIAEQVKALWDNTLAKKATTTLMQRAGHVSMYIRWRAR